MKGRFFIFCLVIFCTTCISKSNKRPQATIAAGASQKDLAILKKTLEEAHPGLYWYSTFLIAAILMAVVFLILVFFAVINKIKAASDNSTTHKKSVAMT